MDDDTSLPGEILGLALVEKVKYYNTHLVNNDGEVGGFHCSHSCHDV